MSRHVIKTYRALEFLGKKKSMNPYDLCKDMNPESNHTCTLCEISSSGRGISPGRAPSALRSTGALASND